MCVHRQVSLLSCSTNGGPAVYKTDVFKGPVGQGLKSVSLPQTFFLFHPSSSILLLLVTPPLPSSFLPLSQRERGSVREGGGGIQDRRACCITL